MRYLGIDYGTKKVGLALSDEAGVMGFPHKVLSNDALLLEAVTELIQQQKVGTIVIGESLNSSGRENTVAKDARAFGESLGKGTEVPVVYEMEAFTTQEARRDFEGNRTNFADVDASAAALILTSYLSRPHDNNW